MRCALQCVLPESIPVRPALAFCQLRGLSLVSNCNRCWLSLMLWVFLVAAMTSIILALEVLRLVGVIAIDKTAASVTGIAGQLVFTSVLLAAVCIHSMLGVVDV